MRLATADLKSRDLMDDGQRRSRQSSIEDDDHLQNPLRAGSARSGLALRPSVDRDRQEPDADLSKIGRGRPDPGQAPALACMRDRSGELQSRFKLC